MHKKNKITLVAAPRPLPDQANTLSVQTNKIKNYLDAIKNSNQGTIPHNYQTRQIQLPIQSSLRFSNSLSNQDILRKRIAELELQNNQFRIMVKQCQTLAAKNKELEEQMLMLLTELEHQTEGQSPIRSIPLSDSRAKQIQEHSTIENIYTQESGKQQLQHQIYPNAFKHESPISREEQNQVFKNVRIEYKSEGTLNQVLQHQNLTIQEYIKQQVKETIASFQTKFMHYIHVIEDQMQQMKLNNQQLHKLKLSSSNSQEEISIRVKENSSSENHHRLPQFKINSEEPIYNTPESQTYSRKEENQNSLINIEMDNISDSEHSFGKSNKPYNDYSKLSVSNPLYTPDSFPKIKSVSNSKDKEAYVDDLIAKVIEYADGIRQNLAFILGEHSKTNRPKLTEFEDKIQSQLHHILATYFQHRLPPVSSLLFSHNINQILLMRSKNRNVVLQERQLFNLQQYTGQNHIFKRINKQDLDKRQSCKLGAPRLCSDQFEETQRKLLQVIEVMRAFNHQYREIIKGSQLHRDIAGHPSL